MRHPTRLRNPASPFWHGLYRNYRKLPASARAPLRLLAAPRWHLASYVIRVASGQRVVDGPFRGMAFAPSPLSRRHHCGYLLGCHEIELRGVIEAIAARDYRTVVNVGAADAYYAVGLALRLPRARVHAFETLAELHPVIRRAGEANGVGARLAVAGHCETGDLQRVLAGAEPPVLVVMDIEGGEAALLDPVGVPQLRGTDILVESHDMFVPDCTESLIARFRATHDIERYRSRPRLVSDFPAGFLPWLRRCFPRLAVDLIDERRGGPQQWLFLTAAAER